MSIENKLERIENETGVEKYDIEQYIESSKNNSNMKVS